MTPVLDGNPTPTAATAKAQHTPGPWHVNRNSAGTHWGACACRDGIHRRDVGEEPERQANACLIAAAPALLAALEGIALGGCCQSPGCSPDDPKCDAMTARDAIAQAKEAK